MSAFGAVYIRIQNPVFSDFLRKYSHLCSEIGDWIKGPKYDFEYDDQYYDVYADGCPKNLDELQDYILEVISEFCDDRFKEFAEEFRANYPVIKSGFTYVRWMYTPDPDDCEIPEPVVFEYGTDPNKTSRPASTLSVKISGFVYGGLSASVFREDLFEHLYEDYEDVLLLRMCKKTFWYRDNPETEVDFNKAGSDIVDFNIFIRFIREVDIESLSELLSRFRRSFGYHMSYEF